VSNLYPIRPDESDDTGQSEQHRGQRRFAERFTAAYDGKFVHVHGIGWHEFDGTRWVPCLDGAETRAMCASVNQALAELSRLEVEARNRLYKDIQKMESNAGIEGALALAGRMHSCTVAGASLDIDIQLLNTASGTVDLRTGHQRAADPRDYLSKVTRGRFDPVAWSEVFDNFLITIQPDPEMRAFLARSLGSALLGEVREHVLLIWHGTGANGKGTLRDAVRHALGNYAVEVPADILLQSKYGQQGLAPERMRLKGARTAFCSEIAAGAKLDEATMNKLTGGDPVNAKLLYRNPIEFDPSHTLFMLTNHLPVVRGDDPAVWRRILAVPFPTVVPAAARDGELPGKLKACPDAVLAWLWHGWLDYQRNGLNPPEAVQAATEKYRLDSDVLARFLADESAVIHGHGRVPAPVLYQAFKDWTRDEGEPSNASNRAFTEAMRSRGYQRRHARSGDIWEDLMLTQREDGGPHGYDR